MSYDYAIKVFNGDKYICVIASKHSNYDNVIWWQLETLIDAYRNKEISKNIFEETIEYETKYFEVGDDYVDLDYISQKIDFLNETITLPSYPIYTFKEIEDAFPVPLKVIKENDQYYLEAEGNKEVLISVSFDKEELLYKSELSFSEFKIVCDFYHSIMDSPYDHILGDKIIKFNEI